MSPFLRNTGQDHHENWTSNQLPVPFPTVHDTLCLLNMVHEQEARSQEKGQGSVGGQQQ